MKSIDALFSAINLGRFWISSKRKSNIPGEIIKLLSSEAREALSKLTSDEIASLRLRWWEIVDDLNKEDEDLLLSFDKKILK